MKSYFKDKRIENAVVKVSTKIIIQDKELISSLLDSIYESADSSEDND